MIGAIFNHATQRGQEIEMATNFTESQNLRIYGATHEGRPLVSITQYAGAMHFVFAMTPSQARDMATELLAEAVKAEALAQQAQGMAA